jgi:hypothetical protein
MSTIAEVRQSVAEAVSELEGVTCTPRPVSNNVRGGDAWVTVGRTTPYDFTESLTVFTVVIALSSDAKRAEAWVEELTVPLLDLLTTGLSGTDVSIEPIRLLAGDGITQSIYALAGTVSLLVSA